MTGSKCTSFTWMLWFCLELQYMYNCHVFSRKYISHTKSTEERNKSKNKCYLHYFAVLLFLFFAPPPNKGAAFLRLGLGKFQTIWTNKEAFNNNLISLDPIQLSKKRRQPVTESAARNTDKVEIRPAWPARENIFISDIFAHHGLAEYAQVEERRFPALGFQVKKI